MNLKKLSFLITSICMIHCVLYSMEGNDQQNELAELSECAIDVIPGWGSTTQKALQRIEQIFPNLSYVFPTIIPPDRFDFAQGVSMDYVHNELKEVEKTLLVSKPRIAVAISNGASTLLNYMSEQARTNQSNPYRPAAILAIAAFASGNSGMLHTLQGKKETQIDPTLGPLLMKLPYAHDWIPFLSQLRYRNYDPAGIQPIKVLEHFPNDPVVIFAHCKDDPRVSFKNTLAMYYLLGSQGHKNMYLLLKEGNKHGDVLTESDRPIIYSILYKHRVIATDINQGIIW